MHKTIIFGAFILSMTISLIVFNASPEIWDGYSENMMAKRNGATLFLFIVLTIFGYLVKYLIRFIIKPLFRYIGKDFQGRENFFEKIFYSKSLGPSLDIKEKDSITKNTKGRLLVLLYSMVYLVIFLFCMVLAGAEGDDEVTLIVFIFLLLGIIPYKFLIPIFSSTYNYIKGEK